MWTADIWWPVISISRLRAAGRMITVSRRADTAGAPENIVRPCRYKRYPVVTHIAGIFSECFCGKRMFRINVYAEQNSYLQQKGESNEKENSKSVSGSEPGAYRADGLRTEKR